MKLSEKKREAPRLSLHLRLRSWWTIQNINNCQIYAYAL